MMVTCCSSTIKKFFLITWGHLLNMEEDKDGWKLCTPNLIHNLLQKIPRNYKWLVVPSTRSRCLPITVFIMHMKNRKIHLLNSDGDQISSLSKSFPKINFTELIIPLLLKLEDILRRILF